MDFLQLKQALMYTSTKYEDIYIVFKDEYDMQYHKLFLICAALGAKFGKATAFESKGREFRQNYFSSDERNLVYSIILNDESKGKDIEKFNDDEFHKEARRLVEQYAEGGMDILVEEVFKEKWDGYNLDRKYKNYNIDLFKYLMATMKEVPF